MGFIATVTKVYRDTAGNVVVEANPKDNHNEYVRKAYLQRQAVGAAGVPEPGWSAYIEQEPNGEKFVTGFVGASEDSTAAFSLGGLKEGDHIVQADEGTAVYLNKTNGKLALHSLNDLVLRAGGTFDIQQGVAPTGSDVTEGTNNGGTAMKLVTQAEWDDIQTRMDAVESASVNTRQGRNSHRNRRNMDYITREGNFDSPSVGTVNTDQTVDAVADLGWDDTGGTAISLSADVQTGRRIEVPAGTYLVDGAPSTTVDRFEMVGKTSNRGDVTFYTGDSVRGYRMNLDGDSIRLAHFTSDLGPNDDGSGLCFNLQGDGIYYENIEHIGFTPDESKTTDYRKADWAVKNPNGQGVMDTYINTGPGHIAGHKDGAGIALPASAHEGTMYVKNTDIRNDNGDAPMYLAGQGYVVFENCYHANNAMAQFRMGGQAVMRNCTAVVDVANQHPDNTGSYADSGDLSGTGSVSGLYWAGQQFKNRGGRIENCIFHYIDRGSANGKPISVDESQVDSLIIGTDIKCDESPNSVIGSANNDYNPGQPHNIDIEDLTVVGSGSPGSIFDFDSAYHDNCLLEASCINIDTTIFGGSASWDKQEYTTSGCSIQSTDTTL